MKESEQLATLICDCIESGMGYPETADFLIKEGFGKKVKGESQRIKKDGVIYGEFKNVVLTQDEYTKLEKMFGNKLTEKIETLSCYKQSTGKKYKDDYATILNWSRKDKVENNNDPDRFINGKYGHMVMR